jgi:hypothetical protein
MKSLIFIWRVLLMIVLLLVLPACSKTSHITTTAPGHKVTGAIQELTSVDNQAGQTVITSQFGTITIERNRVLFNGAEWTTIPADAALELTLTKHKRSLTTSSKTTRKTVKVEISKTDLELKYSCHAQRVSLQARLASTGPCPGPIQVKILIDSGKAFA